ncbi:hypothetical protein [Micromonospora carbonacea]|uniref:Uncharacterized protein n=1 Tax=Micromonospora carbonacea TaxID=47853 RepID=A0A7H8XGZ0_9ACTN|nr:hypothetical protein [Micromonospora carbonacea]MBB5828424.1 hypothetical protein [Micromonospora carbonacea]QLD23970.1 hypothetical protein HXZ27_06860 [Micromonospora carbonacea]
MARFLCWLIGCRPLTGGHPVTEPGLVTDLRPGTVPGAPVPEVPAPTASRPPCTPGRRPRRRARRPLAGTALPRSPWNRSADR